MINNKPRTYNEILRMKKCYVLADFYSNITENIFNEIYNFLGESPNNVIVANQNLLSFMKENSNTLNKTVVKTIPVIPKTTSFDSIRITSDNVLVASRYNSGSNSYWGGSSSNNNNNNNNNNNR